MSYFFAKNVLLRETLMRLAKVRKYIFAFYNTCLSKLDKKHVKLVLEKR